MDSGTAYTTAIDTIQLNPIELTGVVTRIHNMRNLIIIMLTGLLVGCAGTPKFDQERFVQTTTPNQVKLDPTLYQDTSQLWGGILISTTNLDDATRLEVLAYPLAKNQKPQTSRDPIGRFIAINDSYLEPIDYAEGRLVTLAGKLANSSIDITSSNDNFAKQFPVLSVEQLHLWSKDGRDTGPQVLFGFGISLGF